MSWTTLNLQVQACGSNNHYILIMESRFKRKIMLEIDIHVLTWNAQLNIHANKKINLIPASMHEWILQGELL